MAKDAKAVAERRALRFRSLDEVLADAERLAASPHTTVGGNWPLSQLFTHLTAFINGSIDGVAIDAPWFIRLVGRLLKGYILKNKMRSGFRLPKEAESRFFPPAASLSEALDGLRRAVHRAQQEKMTASHPVLGKLTHAEWTELHLRHAELHLSFARPD